MRSMLFVPADSEKKMAKAAGSPADALILDLEDSVAAGNKIAARAIAAAFIRDMRGKSKRPRLTVRINALDTAFWPGDVAAMVPAAPETIILPKPSGHGDVLRLSDALAIAEAGAGLAVGSTKIIVIATEVPAALFQLGSYAGGSPRLEGISWGAEDLSAMVGSSATREADGRTWTTPYMMARNLSLMAAIAAGAQPIDTVYVNFRDLDGLRGECELAARDGFTGKMAIHPDQVATINAAFTPTAREIAWAREIVQLFRDNPNSGTIGLRGQMIDKPHLMRAERVLARVVA